MSARYDFTIEQGTDWSLPITWKDANDTAIDNTGYVFYLQANSGNTTVIDLWSPDDGITLGGSDGVITFVLDKTATAALSFDTAAYNVEYTDSQGDRKRLMKGYITLDKDIVA